MSVDEMFVHVLRDVKERGLCKTGSKAVCLYGAGEGTPEEVNYMKVMHVA
jgi:hypothetical protein